MEWRLASDSSGVVIDLTGVVVSFCFRFAFVFFAGLAIEKREFVKKNYKDLKTKNPSFPFLVRECEGAEAKVWARYDKGVEKNVSVEGLTAKSVEEQLQTLVTQKA